ncbi:histidine phosphatase family protein [Donghicola mangrovi]|uniref:Histidine phosphatase family protein n=1 Tax=Donghicola mangrovi TaxID=2729614 RepID=A0A850Q9F7_9RHOB|nr:histidine phosphatase family protein [Donghicola mangrovi]NVO22601.1 histidine phosphatase family protein [Donghicola mangrovi]
MTEITLVRHGQANSGAQDEANYDRLSELGHQQAAWLGEHLQTVSPYDRIISGAMRRQIETAQGLNRSALPHDTDPRLNELDYFGLAESLKNTHGIPIPTCAPEFASHVPQVLDVWRNGGIHPDIESYAAFHDRIFGALHAAASCGERCLLVTSTGVISTLTAIALGLETAAKVKMFLSVTHTSVHKFELRGDDLYLTQFGATPHLDHPDRQHAKTHV